VIRGAGTGRAPDNVSGFAMPKAKRISIRSKDYTLGSPEFAKPVLTTTHFPELLALANQATFDFGTDANGDVREKLWVLEEYFQKKRLSNGESVSPRLATMLATIVHGVEARKGGRPRKSKKTVKP
jgi:hypothetical protein